VVAAYGADGKFVSKIRVGSPFTETDPLPLLQFNNTWYQISTLVLGVGGSETVLVSPQFRSPNAVASGGVLLNSLGGTALAGIRQPNVNPAPREESVVVPVNVPMEQGMLAKSFKEAMPVPPLPAGPCGPGLPCGPV
jgi:hypothetical protein